MKFITSNKYKFEEMKLFFPSLEHLDIELTEIQELDIQKITEAKLREAQKYTPKGTEVVVEDTSVVFHEMNNLPGPLIKWFLDDLGLDGIWNIAKDFKNKKATAVTMIGYLDKESNTHFFRADVVGSIVEPSEIGFGWNPLFKLETINKNYTEMNQHEKEKFSMRAQAAKKLVSFINNR